VGTNPEGLVLAAGGLFVANNGFGFSRTVSLIDPDARTVTATLDVGCDGPKTLGTDAGGEVWVFCTGKTVYDPETFEVIERTNGEAVVLDGFTGSEVARLPLDDQLGAGGILGQEAVVVSRPPPSSNSAWAVVGNQITRFDTSTNTRVVTFRPQVPEGYLLSAIAYDHRENRFFLGAVPPDFVSSGEVVITDLAGLRLGSFDAGILPAAIVVR
jgi:hypothetical protein